MQYTERRCDMDRTFSDSDKNKMSLLIAEKENEIWRIIHQTNDSKTDSLYSVNYVEYLILSYIFVSKTIGEDVPYSNVKDFFCYCNQNGLKEYETFQNSNKYKDNSVYNEDKIIFILRHTEGEICREIFDVLNDCENDPHHSAVYTSNMIKCFIDIVNQTERTLLYNDVFGFFTAHGFSYKNYVDFEEKRKKESSYYRGVQY